MLAFRPLVLLALAAAAPAARADFVNGGFESGLTGWQAVGDVLAVGPGVGTPPSAGGSHALLTTASADGDANTFSGMSAAPAADVFAFLGLPVGAVLPVGFEGSALRQTFTAQAGDVLTLRYNFVTTEGFNADFAFVTLAGVPAVLAAGPFAPSAVVLDPVFGSPATETGYRTYTTTIQAAGTYTLGVGVLDAGDEFFPSALLLDGVTLAPADPGVPPAVPLPPSAVLLGIGLAAAVRLVRRRR